jgi:hypothetical protein
MTTPNADRMMAMARKKFQPSRPQFSISVERNGVEISRDTLYAADAAEARAIFVGLMSSSFFDPLDGDLRCLVEQVDWPLPTKMSRASH